ncbi:MAG: hypothetical protein GY719_34865 [bacterium]|nr:hypothetical protein [bacterium]
MSPEIQQADARFRTRFLLAMTVVAVVAAAGLVMLDDYLTELQTLAERAQPIAAEKTLKAARVVFALLTAGGAVLGLYLGRVSWRALRSGRFPPPGTRVLSDTVVRRGAAARLYGRAGLAFAVITVLLTALIVVQGDRLFRRLLDTSLKPTPYTPPAELDAPGRR